MTYIVQLLIFLILTIAFISKENNKFKTYETSVKSLKELDDYADFIFYNTDCTGLNYKRSEKKDNIFYYEK